MNDTRYILYRLDETEPEQAFMELVVVMDVSDEVDSPYGALTDYLKRVDEEDGLWVVAQMSGTTPTLYLYRVKTAPMVVSHAGARL